MLMAGTNQCEGRRQSIARLNRHQSLPAPAWSMRRYRGPNPPTSVFAHKIGSCSQEEVGRNNRSPEHFASGSSNGRDPQSGQGSELESGAASTLGIVWCRILAGGLVSHAQMLLPRCPRCRSAATSRLIAPPMATSSIRTIPTSLCKGARRQKSTTANAVKPAWPAVKPTALERYAETKTAQGNAIQYHSWCVPTLATITAPTRKPSKVPAC
jgi:hypothetical protein